MWEPELNCMSSVFVSEIAGNEPQQAVGRFAAFLCLFLSLEVFGDDDS